MLEGDYNLTGGSQLKYCGLRPKLGPPQAWETAYTPPPFHYELPGSNSAEASYLFSSLSLKILTYEMGHV